MSSGELQIVIGATYKEAVPAMVCARSILERASCEVRIIHTYFRTFSCPPGATGFSFLRFASPELVDRKGRVLYLDSDMLILGDVAEFLAMDFMGQDILCPPNQASVLLMNAETAPFSLESVVAQARELPFKKVLSLQAGISDAKVARIIPNVWNCLDEMPEGAKNLHYTNMTNQPWLAARPRNKRHPYADIWFEELRGTYRDRLVTLSHIEEGVISGHLHSECVACLSYSNR